ncbi:MAG: RnfABCDGE type electron transport complex subunit D [Enterococcus sp.]
MNLSKDQQKVLVNLRASNLTLRTAPSPHLNNDTSTRQIMGNVILALTPIVLVSGYYFGWRVYGLYLLACITAQLTEIVWFKMNQKPLTFDLSVIVTGLLLTMSLPPSAPWFFPVIGSFFAILIVKEFFGGLGYNFLNPALSGRALLVILFFDEMFKISWPKPPFGKIEPAAVEHTLMDATSSATPLGAMKAGESLNTADLWQMFIGNTGGRIGETSTLLIMGACLFLIWRKIIPLHIPAIIIGIVGVGAWLFADSNGLANWQTVVGHLFGGGLWLGAVFMATDYSSSPATKIGECLYATGIGMLIIVLRFWGPTNEGVSYAILAMNCCVPLIDRVVRLRVLGEPGLQKFPVKLDK